MAVQHNSVSNYVIGVVVENTIHVTVRDNQLKANTAGIYVAVLPDHPRPFTDDVLVERNQVLHNNLPNPVPADSDDEIGGVPTGVGIVNLGSDHVATLGSWAWTQYFNGSYKLGLSKSTSSRTVTRGLNQVKETFVTYSGYLEKVK